MLFSSPPETNVNINDTARENLPLNLAIMKQTHIQLLCAIPQTVYTKRKQPCIGGMKLVSLSCNCVFISAESEGEADVKSRLQLSDTSSMAAMHGGFVFMPWSTDKYTFKQ